MSVDAQQQDDPRRPGQRGRDDGMEAPSGGSAAGVADAAEDDELLLVRLKQTGATLLQDLREEMMLEVHQHAALAELHQSLEAAGVASVDCVGRRYEFHQPLPSGKVMLDIGEGGAGGRTNRPVLKMTTYASRYPRVPCTRARSRSAAPRAWTAAARSRPARRALRPARPTWRWLARGRRRAGRRSGGSAQRWPPPARGRSSSRP